GDNRPQRGSHRPGEYDGQEQERSEDGSFTAERGKLRTKIEARSEWRVGSRTCRHDLPTRCSLLATRCQAAPFSQKTGGTMPRKGIRRRWYLDLHGIRREGRKETGFHYRYPDGRAVADERSLARIRKLRVPPAWRDVRIARGDSSPLQAVGVDKKGRTQYRYHDRFRAQREEEKFRRVVEFGESLPDLRRRVHADLKRSELDRQRVLAAIVRLIDQGFFRVGNDKSARSELTYGLTTIQGKHVKVAGADQLGNTAAVCRSAYICPRLLDEYMEGKPFETLRKTRKGKPVVRVGLSMEERALLKFLRETIADRRRHAREKLLAVSY